MKCNIYLKIGDESILIAKQMDSSLIPSEVNEDFLNIVKDSGKINLLKSKLEEVLLDGITEAQIEGIDKDEIGDYLIANTTAKELSLSCPGISFPNIDLSKIKVKQIDKFKSYGTNIIIKTSPNGEPIYLLDGNLATIKKFARHLAIEDAINNQVLDKLDKNSNELKIIDKVLEKAKVKYPKTVKDRQSLLRHYIKNKSKYNKINITEGNNIYTASVLLDEILPLIENIYYPKNNIYSTPLLKSLHGPGGIIYNNGKPQISYSDLYSILSGSLDLSMFKSQKEFNELLKSNKKFENQEEYEKTLAISDFEERNRKFQELIESDETFKTLDKFFKQFGLDITNPDLLNENNYSILFQQIFSKERGYPYSYLSVSKEGIVKFKSNYGSKEEAYGLSYDTIISLPKTSYKGWNIVTHQLSDGNVEYFISQYELQPSSFGKHYNSKKEAKAAIDKKLSEQTFKSSFFIQLYQKFDKISTNGVINIDSKTDTVQKGNVITIPRISLPNKIDILDPRENIIQGNSTIEDFKDVIREWPKEVQDLLILSSKNPILRRDAEKIIKQQPQEVQDLLLDKRTKKILPNALQILLSSESISGKLKNKLLIGDKLIPEIDTIEKAGVFLALLNIKYQNRERTPEMINDILRQIKEANEKPIHFYVEESSIIKIPKRDKVTKEILKDREGNIIYNETKQLKIVKIPDPEGVSEADIQKNGFQYPIISFWEDSAQTLNKVFGTKINVLTQSEIEDQFGTKYSGAKAFIIGDNVYINSTIGSTEDLFHEYIHIIMGYLKVNNPEVYSTLLEQVWKYTNNEDKKKIYRDYKEDNYISKLEENFARRFSEYIYNRGENKLDEIFASSELEEAFDTIFDKSDFNLKELGKHELSEIFSRFSSEISMALQKNDKLFGTFASSEQFRLNNKKTNLLQKWIREGKIKEFNCR